MSDSAVDQAQGHVVDMGVAMGTSGRDRTILVVEDDPDSREILTRILEEVIGARVLSAADGEIALRRVRESHPDLILLDLRLPRVDGWQVLRELRGDRDTSNIPVIVVTTATGQQARQTARSAGAADFVEKPFDLERLEAAVTRHLHPA